jgi:transposase, IS5 family
VSVGKDVTSILAGACVTISRRTWPRLARLNIFNPWPLVGLAPSPLASEGSTVRTSFPRHYQTQTTPIESVVFQLRCRHELIPILVALQHVYARTDLCAQLLKLIEQDITRDTQAQRGRPGLSYWEILVLAAVRLGCNCNYDALHDLAENHRTLRQIMGVADDPIDPEQPSPYLWHRLRDNLCRLQPETLKHINQLLVGLGHELERTAGEQVRGDSFVVETNIHYPTEASLLGDGCRKILDLARELRRLLPLEAWRQKHWRKRLKKALWGVSRASRSKAKNAALLKQRAYQALYEVTEPLLAKGRQLAEQVAGRLAEVGILVSPVAAALHQQLQEFVQRTAQVLDYSRRRVLQGETIANHEKLFSLFESHTQLINRGKQPQPIEFGHKVLVIEDSVGFICHYHILNNTETDKDTVVAQMTQLKQRQAEIKSASFDSGFHTPENQEKLATLIPLVCIPKRGAKQARRQAEQAGAAFQEARRAHPGVESLIGALQRGHGLKRCRDRGQSGYARYVGIAVLGHNLQTLGKLLLRQQDAECLAGITKRKRRAAVA